MSVGIRGGLGVIRVKLTRGWPGCRRRRLELAGVALDGVPARQIEREKHQGELLALVHRLEGKGRPKAVRELGG